MMVIDVVLAVLAVVPRVIYGCGFVRLRLCGVRAFSVHCALYVRCMCGAHTSMYIV